MKRKKTLWIICMLLLCLVLYTIVISRTDNLTEVIFGGADGAYIKSDSVSFLDPAASTPEPTVNIWPEIDITLPQYTIANEEHKLSSAYEPEVTKIQGSYMMFATSAIDQLEAMLQALRDEGFSVYVGGAYRTYSYQAERFNGKASQIALGMGISDYMDPKYQEAVEEAKTLVMFPGCSEHQLGLAVDLMDKEYYPVIYENMNQEFFEWLDAHCAEYGFIKRYPTRKLLLTGWDEPWHYRYVGVEAATFIMEHGICYEEFYAHYDPEFTY